MPELYDAVEDFLKNMEWEDHKTKAGVDRSDEALEKEQKFLMGTEPEQCLQLTVPLLPKNIAPLSLHAERTSERQLRA